MLHIINLCLLKTLHSPFGGNPLRKKFPRKGTVRKNVRPFRSGLVCNIHCLRSVGGTDRKNSFNYAIHEN